MADCFSLPNAAEVVERLRSCAIAQRNYEEGITPDKFLAADAIEQLLTENESYRKAFLDLHIELSNLYEENAKLKAERDAAVADLKNYGYCKNCSKCTTKYGFYLCKIYGTVYWNDTCDDWEWRGVTDKNIGSKKEEEDATD